MIHAIAIDDEPRALDIIKNHAARIPFLTLLHTFTNPFEALVYINENAVEVIFLDIKMPDISGMELLKSINNGKFIVIFTTAYSEYALESYEVNALDYLLKPFDFSRFLKAVNKAQEKLKLSDGMVQDFFFVSTGYQQHKITFDEISYIEGEGNYLTYHVKGEKIVVRSTIKETIKLLPPSMFIQIHRSFIISLKKLHKIQDNHAFIGNDRIPLGANYKESFLKIIGKVH